MSDVLPRVEGRCGRITLNRPKALNALTLGMVRGIQAALEAWEQDPAVEFVMIDGAGERGLCAGGDVRAIYDAARAGDFAAVERFFREEYELNQRIADYPKPYLALMDGIVMGGGVGVSAHGAVRVVTERSVLAMPEARIGFVTDVGATYLLSRTPGELGTYLGLTSARIGAADAIACGLADVYVEGDRVAGLVAELMNRGGAEAGGCVRSFSAEPPAGRLSEGRGWIDACFGEATVEGIVAALAQRPEAEAGAAAEEIAKNSPTSLKVILEALRRGRVYGALGPCLAQELVLAQACVREGDFCEGVRAALVDKDRSPRWRPARLEEVAEERVKTFFEPAVGAR
jgi:enoyl-CoA hydratase